MSCNVISQKPINHDYSIVFTYLLLTYLFTKIESGYPVPKPVPT